MSEHKLTYGRGRFPKQPKRSDGTWGCRGCGGPLPKGRTAWCSSACVDRFHPAMVISAVKERDKDVCQLCGFDCEKGRREWYVVMRALGYRSHHHWKQGAPPRPPKAEYDHIVPFSEGGLTVLENMRTLCAPCHRKVTAEWRRTKKGAKP